MAVDPPPDLLLTPLQGQARTMRQLLTTFHLFFVALDPYTDQSAWILPTAERVLTGFEQADCRVAIVITAGPDDARRFLGPNAEHFITFTDPDRTVVKAFGLEYLPAVVHVGSDGTLVNAAEGWNPGDWQKVTDTLAKVMSWKGPSLPGPKDPAPFRGSPAQG